MSDRGDRFRNSGEVVYITHLWAGLQERDTALVASQYLHRIGFSDTVHAEVKYPVNEEMATDPTLTISETGGVLFGVSVEAVEVPAGRKQTIKRPPGSMLEAVLYFIYARKTREAVFDQLIYDMREEYNDALFVGERWRARWIRVRGTCAIFKAMGLHRIVSLAKKAGVIWKAI